MNTFKISVLIVLAELQSPQVLCSSMVFREDVDIGTLWVGDLHKKSRCLQMRVEEIVQSLQHVRSTSVRLFNCGLGAEDATDDIAPDLHCTRALLGEEVEMSKEDPPKMIAAEAHEAISLESLDSIPMHCDFDGVDRINTQDMSFPQLPSELQNSPQRFVPSHPFVDPLHVLQIPPTHLAKWGMQVSWFYRTPSLTIAIGPPGGRTLVSPARIINLDDCTPVASTRDQAVNSSGSSQNAAATEVELEAILNDPYTSVKNIGEGSTATKDSNPSTPPACTVVQVEEHVQPMELTPPRPKPAVDKTLDDTLGRTTQKSDGR